MEGEELADGMTNSYWIQAYPALAATKMMAKQGVRGRIVFVSSTLGYMGFIGYSTYSPGKHAVVGLTETLRSELALYNIDVQLFVPCTMYTEGYENENKTKPEITLQIESTDEGLTADQAALHMLKGMRKELRIGSSISPSVMEPVIRVVGFVRASTLNSGDIGPSYPSLLRLIRLACLPLLRPHIT
ncbi:3-dehydrosphinganine reductase [Serendipita sp. 399]|nr:3-dehydrosphinganine reductase [Serendipita sp. 399]